MARTTFAALVGAAIVAGMAVVGGSNPAQAQVIGVSWSNFQEERWKTDEAAIKAAIAAGGGSYVSADAQSSAAKQLADIEALMARGAKALIEQKRDVAKVEMGARIVRIPRQRIFQEGAR